MMQNAKENMADTQNDANGMQKLMHARKMMQMQCKIDACTQNDANVGVMNAMQCFRWDKQGSKCN